MEQVVIIGGGLAGLAAGCELADQGYKILLVERRPSLGGRACSLFSKKIGEEVDIGQHVFLGCCRAYIQFLERIGAQGMVRLQPRLSVAVRSLDGRLARISGSKLPGPLYLLPSLWGFPFLNWRERFTVGRSMLTARLTNRRRAELDKSAFRKWLGLSAGDVGLRGFWDFLILPTLNDHPKNVSASMGLMVLQEAFLKRHGADIGYAWAGLSRLAGRAAEYMESRGGKVLLNRGAKALLVEGDRVQGVALSDGQVLAADSLISAVPPSALLKLLPGEWREHPFFARASRLRWNPIVNLHLWFEEPVMEEQLIACWKSHLQWVFNRSKILGRPGPTQHLCISLSNAWEYIDLPSERILQILLAELRELFPRARQAKVEKYLAIKQRRATISLAPGMEQYRLPPRTPLENLFLAGDWIDVGWPSTMEGAVRSGLECARQIKGLKRERSLGIMKSGMEAQ